MRRLGLLLLAMAATPALAVGLGPLAKDGLIDGPRQAFFLTVYNPYPQPAEFVAYPIGIEDERAEERVAVLPAEMQLGPGQSRRLLVIADRLTVGETFRFRVCAARKEPDQGITIHARVCSKLSTRRVG